jgi:hypothetical protein
VRARTINRCRGVPVEQSNLSRPLTLSILERAIAESGAPLVRNDTTPGA